MKTYTRKGEWLELTLGPDRTGLPAIEALSGLLPAGFAKKLIDTDGVRIQGAKMRLRLFPEETDRYADEWADDWREVEVLYEDDFCLVVGKPAGMAVHPASSGQRGTLAHAVAGYYACKGERCRVRHIHRLDEQTTGPVLYAKNELAQLVFDEAMRRKAIGRTYIAFVSGSVRDRTGTVDAPIGKDRHHGSKRRVSRNGDPAVTHYERLEALGSVSLVKLRLETGRTHQIRVHMSHLGHPLLGDVLYGGPDKLIGRQALHGAALSFGHPLTGEEVKVEAAWPDDLLELYRKLKRDK
ncbi:RluA family pseudouridine synthase [Paenibacillus sp. MBLB4367]|uniref:RluA family pseudouridine synthase n=1 Tax=Paenibacillus sp. MBLB4367 TaxID=3384767 RepID=UPI0039082A76